MVIGGCWVVLRDDGYWRMMGIDGLWVLGDDGYWLLVDDGYWWMMGIG